MDEELKHQTPTQAKLSHREETKNYLEAIKLEKLNLEKKKE